jgi:hypothetical protein
MDPRGSPQGIAARNLTTSARIAAAYLDGLDGSAVSAVSNDAEATGDAIGTTMSGRTTNRAVRQSRHVLANTIQNSRSRRRRVGRLTWRFNAHSC